MNNESISAVSQSVQDLNQILQHAQKQSLDLAKKMVKVGLEQTLSSEPGKGETIDCSA